MSTAAAADILGISRQHVLNLVAAGRLTPAHTIATTGGRVAVYLFDVADLAQFADHTPPHGITRPDQGDDQ